MTRAHSPDTDVRVVCPETGVRTRVTMGWDVEGDPVIDGCARFWGNLHCDTPCWEDAVTAFDALRGPPVYCGDPKLGAPGGRGDLSAG